MLEAGKSATAVENLLCGTSAKDPSPKRLQQLQASCSYFTPDEDPGAAGPHPFPSFESFYGPTPVCLSTQYQSGRHHGLWESCPLISPVLSAPYSLHFWGTSWSSQGWTNTSLTFQFFFIGSLIEISSVLTPQKFLQVDQGDPPLSLWPFPHLCCILLKGSLSPSLNRFLQHRVTACYCEFITRQGSITLVHSDE